MQASTPQGDDHDAVDAAQPRRRNRRRIVRNLLLLAIIIAAAMTPWSDIRRSFAHYAAPAPSGPYGARIDVVTVIAPPESGYGAIDVRFIYPTTRSLAPGEAGWPLLLYVSGWQGAADDNDPLLLELASRGFAIAAMDDIYREDPPADEDPDRAAAREGVLDYSSDEALARMLELSDLRVEMQRVKVSAVLDGLIRATVTGDLPVTLDFERVGAIGFSFGGATALEAMAHDPRIGAVINMDGGLAGVSARQVVAGAYLEMRSTEDPVRLPSWIQWLRPRNEFLVKELDIQRDASRRQLERRDAHVVTIWGAAHGDFSAALHHENRWRRWRPWRPPLIEAERAYEIRGAYILSFLETYLRDRPHPLISSATPPYVEARLGP